MTDVYYDGTVDDWSAIDIGSGNSCLTNASIHSAIAKGTCGTNLVWTLTDTGVLKINGTGNMSNYSSGSSPWYSNRSSITSCIINSDVLSIGDYAFYNCVNITSVAIPDSITSIGGHAFYDCTGLKTAGPIGGEYDYKFGWTSSIPDNAFSGCSGLTSIIIPNSITSIGSHAFSYCSSLINITIPSGVTRIGSYAFSYCSSLTSITIPNRVTSINSFVFSYCPSLTSVTIPNSVIFIESYAFSGCSSLSSVTIPNSVSIIGSHAFSGCSSLTGVTIPKSVNSIGISAFSNCSSLTSVTIPNNVRNIYNDAFSGCSGLTSVSILGSTTSVSYGAFSGCSRLKTAGPIGGGYDYEFGWTSSIPDRAFSNCSSLTSITIPNSVTCIEELAFDDCSSLTSIIIPNSVTSIGICAFRGCSNLTSINIPSTVTSIGSSAFYNCSSLTSITILNSVTSIGGYAFNNCSGLKTAGPIGGGYDYEFGWIDTIPEYAFYSCSGLISVTIPNSVTSIGSYAFYSCSKLTSVTIPNSVASIGDYAFQNCSGLTSVTIQNNVTMGIRVFAGCTNLSDSDGFIIHNHVLYGYTGSATDIYIPYGVTKIDNYAFTRQSGLTSVTIPTSVTSIGSYAFYYCSGLASVTIPNSVTSIGDRAFEGCSGLTNVTVPDNIPNMGNNIFAGCTNLYLTNSDGFTIFNHILYGYSGDSTDINIPDSVTSIADYAFSEHQDLTSVIIPNSVTSIGVAAFQNCANLTSVLIPSSVTNIGNSAFLNCSALMTAGPIGGGYNYEFGWTNTIPNNAFFGCNNLTSVTIPDSVTCIGENAFETCERLTSITIPDSVTSIGFGAFENSGLTSITIPNYVESIGNFAFQGCRYLTNITIPYGVTSIGESVFENSGLTSITIPDSVTNIGDYAFRMCHDLMSITIPNSIISIGTDAFYDCYSLKNFHIDSVESWLKIEHSYFLRNPICYSLYINDTELTSAIIPDSVTSIGDGAFYNCISLTSVTIPDSVTSIGERAFYLCSNLASVTIPGSITSIGEYAFADCPSLSNVTIQCGTNYWDNSFSSPTEIDIIHTSVISDAVVNPTCESTGLTAGSHCETCGAIIEETEVINALGHEWGMPEYTWSSDHNMVTAVHTCMRDSAHVETETVIATAVITVPATCTEMGQTTYTGMFENEAFAVQTETLTDIDAIGHQWSEPYYNWSVDNTTVTASHVCAHDETHIETETVNATSEVTLPATCTEQGQTTYTSDLFENEAFSVQTKTLSDIELVAHTVVTDPAVSPTDTQSGLTEGSHCSVCGEILTAQQTIPPLLWEIDKSDGKISIVRHYGNEDELSIPSSLEGCPVRSILNGAFPYENCPARVFIPDSIQSISSTAFERNVTIYCHEYSEADYWAEENEYTAIYVDNTVSGTFYRITMPDDFTMEYDESRKLGAVIWPLTGDDSIQIISSNPEVVVAEGQTLTATGVGQATITLQVGGKTASVVVSVHANPVNFVIEDEHGYSDEVFYIV